MDLKILSLFQTFFYGIKSFEALLNENSSIICPKKYCIQKDYKFKQICTFNVKYLQIYVKP